jgi:hypothetical protein
LKRYYYYKPSAFKFIELLSTSNASDLLKLGKFLNAAVSLRKKSNGYSIFSYLLCTFSIYYVHMCSLSATLSQNYLLIYVFLFVTLMSLVAQGIKRIVIELSLATKLRDFSLSFQDLF